MPDELERRRADLAASYQRAIVDALVGRVRDAAEQTRPRARSPSSAASPRTRSCGCSARSRRPPLALCTDNAAMIASAARWVEPLAAPRLPRSRCLCSCGVASPPPRSSSVVAGGTLAARGRRPRAHAERRDVDVHAGRRPPGEASSARPPRRRARPARDRPAQSAVARRPRAASGRVGDQRQERRWTAAALASQEQFLAELAAQGIVARPDLQFTRVVNGFSAVADPSAVVLLERSPRVAGVFPVRAAFPAASAETADAAAARCPSGLAAYRGTRSHGGAARHGCRSRHAVPPRPRAAWLRRHRRRRGCALRPASRRRSARDARHRDGGHRRGPRPPGSPAGSAPDVTVLPIRVAGWQRDLGRQLVDLRPDRPADRRSRARRRPEPERRRARCRSHHPGPPVRAVLGLRRQPARARRRRGPSRSTRSSSFPAGNDGPGGPGSGRSAARAVLPTRSPPAPPTCAPASPASRRRSGRAPGVPHRPLELLTSARRTQGRRFELVAVGDARSVSSTARARAASPAAPSSSPAGPPPRRRSRWPAAQVPRSCCSAETSFPSASSRRVEARSVPVLSAPAALAVDVRAARRQAGEAVIADDRAGPTRSRPAPAFARRPSRPGGSASAARSSPTSRARRRGRDGGTGRGRERLLAASSPSAARASPQRSSPASRHGSPTRRPALDAAGLRAALVGTARTARRRTRWRRRGRASSTRPRGAVELVPTLPRSRSAGAGATAGRGVER